MGWHWALAAVCPVLGKNGWLLFEPTGVTLNGAALDGEREPWGDMADADRGPTLMTLVGQIGAEGVEVVVTISWSKLALWRISGLVVVVVWTTGGGTSTCCCGGSRSRSLLTPDL